MSLLTKQCGKCKETKSVIEFQKYRRSKDGFRYECKLCRSKYRSSPENKAKEKEYNAKRYATPECRTMELINRMRNKKEGKRATLEKSLMVEDILPAVLKGKCQLTGLAFDFKPAKNTSKNPYAPSLDRIDSQKGYTKDNVRIVLSAVNDSLGEYSDETMLPILKAMVKAIEKNVNEKSTTPVSARTHSQSGIDAKHRLVLTTRIRKDGNDLNHHSGAIHRIDIDHSTQTGGGDSLEPRGYEVATPQAPESRQNYGDSSPAARWPFELCRPLFDKP